MLKLNIPLDLPFFSGLLNQKRYYMPASAALGAAASFSLAPHELWFVMLLCLSGLLTVQAFFRQKRQVFWSGFLFLVCYNFSNLDFVNFVMQDFGKMNIAVSSLITLLLSSYLALPYALLQTAAFALSRGRMFVFLLFFTPVAYMVSDGIIYHLFTGFPWNFLGYSQLGGPLEAYAPLIGVQGINLMVYVMCASLALSAMRKFVFLPVAAVILFFAILMMGSQFTEEGREYEAHLVQANIRQAVKWEPEELDNIIQKHLEMSLGLLSQKGMLLIWSESAIPIFKERAPGLMAGLNDHCIDSGSVLVMGIQTWDRVNEKAYNSIVTLGTDADLGRMPIYHKNRLVPFGEVVPFGDLLRPLAPIFNFPMSSFSPGGRVQENTVIGDLRLINAICYESIFPDHLVANNTPGSGGILMLSNDGWFGNSRGPYMHLNIARMRTLELQKPMLRATNNGVTAIINHKGEVTHVLPRNTEAILRGSFTSYTGMTPYAVADRWPALFITLILLALGVFYRYRKDDSTSDTLQRMVRP